MSDDSPLNDPRFPDRPTHPDFWALSEIVLQHDGKITEGHMTLPEVVAELGLDFDSLLYMARHRVANYLDLRPGEPVMPECIDAVMAGWLDAFLAGVAFARR